MCQEIVHYRRSQAVRSAAAANCKHPTPPRRIADVADKYQVPMVKITGGQRIDLLGVKKEQLPAIWKDLGMPRSKPRWRPTEIRGRVRRRNPHTKPSSPLPRP